MNFDNEEQEMLDPTRPGVNNTPHASSCACRICMDRRERESRAMSAYYAKLDWTEDAGHENGNYANNCIFCHRQFIGHKRRVSCKACQAVHP